MIVLDTHIWIWWVDGSSKLGELQAASIEEAQKQGEVGISVISCWEIAMLEARKRLRLRTDVRTWLQDELSYPGLHLLPIHPDIAVDSTRLPGPFHADPADRMIVATARHYQCSLVTSDRKILEYEGVRSIGPK